MWARIRFDLSWSDILFACVQCFSSSKRTVLLERIEQYWSLGEPALVCFSVRSGFDLLLQALQWPPKSEILFSALNVKGMIKIVKRHNLTSVPLDLALDYMAPNVKDLERAITPRTRAIVVAHLFGTRLQLDEIFEMARRHNLFIIEDCAQAFDGKSYSGHSLADVSMFSFGPLKTASALGGAIVKVQNKEVLGTMRVLQSQYPVQSQSAYFTRLLKFAGLKVLTSRTVFSFVFRVFQLRAQDYEDAMSNTVRSVAQLGSSKKLRQQPADALLAMLDHRLKRWKVDGLADRTRVGQMLNMILDGAVPCPGEKNPIHTYWVFPILANNPSVLIQELRKAGFDGARLGRSEAVAAPVDRQELTPIHAKEILSKMVILPCYVDMPMDALKRLAGVVKKEV